MQVGIGEQKDRDGKERQGWVRIGYSQIKVDIRG